MNWFEMCPVIPTERLLSEMVSGFFIGWNLEKLGLAVYVLPSFAQTVLVVIVKQKI